MAIAPSATERLNAIAQAAAALQTALNAYGRPVQVDFDAMELHRLEMAEPQVVYSLKVAVTTKHHIFP